MVTRGFVGFEVNPKTMESVNSEQPFLQVKFSILMERRRVQPSSSLFQPDMLPGGQ